MSWLERERCIHRALEKLLHLTSLRRMHQGRVHRAAVLWPFLWPSLVPGDRNHELRIRKPDKNSLHTSTRCCLYPTSSLIHSCPRVEMTLHTPMHIQFLDRSGHFIPPTPEKFPSRVLPQIYATWVSSVRYPSSDDRMTYQIVVPLRPDFRAAHPHVYEKLVRIGPTLADGVLLLAGHLRPALPAA